MGKESECRAISRLLGDYANDRLNKQETDHVEHHLSHCQACQGVANTLNMFSQYYNGPQTDLWPKLESRLSAQEESDNVPLRFPSIAWPVPVALALVMLIFMVVPEPWRLLIIIGFL